MILLPAAVFIFLFGGFRRRDPEGDRGLRRNLLEAAVAWTTLLVAVTEALGAAHALRRGPLAWTWALAATLTAAWALAAPRRSPSRIASVALVDRLLLAGLAAYTILELVIALAAPPNNWDSMTYHMSRVMHWAQNGSVAFYPTHIQRQLYTGPGAEYVILHAQILTGGDRLANLVQWGAMAGSLAAVSLLGAGFGLGPRGQLLAAVFAGTLPMGVLQATSTQNDYVTGFWLLCFLVFASRTERAWRWRDVGLASAALGLALLTKPTAYVFAAPFVAWWGLRALVERRLRVVPILAAAATIVLLLNGAFYARNYALWRNPISRGHESGWKFLNESFTPRDMASGIVRDLALHAGLPWEPWNRWVEERVSALLGDSLNDPLTTWKGTRFARPRFSYHEDEAGNPLHLALIALAYATMACVPSVRRRPGLVPHALALLGAFLLFAVLLKWDPWHGRLHLPLFLAAAPMVAAALEPRWGPCGGAVLAALMLVAGTPFLLFNSLRPLVGRSSVLVADRTSQYFRGRPDLFEPYRAAADWLTREGHKDVGLFLGPDDWEYPLWVLLAERGSGFRLHHVDVSLESGRLGSSPVSVVLCTSCGGAPPVGGSAPPAARFGRVSVWPQRPTSPGVADTLFPAWGEGCTAEGADNRVVCGRSPWLVFATRESRDRHVVIEGRFQAFAPGRLSITTAGSREEIVLGDQPFEYTREATIPAGGKVRVDLDFKGPCPTWADQPRCLRIIDLRARSREDEGAERP